MSAGDPVTVPQDAAPLVIAHREAHLGIATDLKPARSRPAVGGGEWVAKTDDDGTVTLTKSAQVRGVDRARSDFQRVRSKFATAKSKSDAARKWADETWALAREERPRATIETAQEREARAVALEKETDALQAELDALVAAHPVLRHDIAVAAYNQAKADTERLRGQIASAQARADRWAEYEAGLKESDSEDGPKGLDDVQAAQRDACQDALDSLKRGVDRLEQAEAEALARAQAVSVETSVSERIVVRLDQPFLVV